MDKVFATYRDGTIVLDQSVDWPDGTRLQLEPQPSSPPDHHDELPMPTY